MSYGEELMTEMLIAEALEEQDRKDQVCRFYGAIGAKVWITSDGSSISIRKMDSRHIRNCISMLKGNNEHDAKEISASLRHHRRARLPPGPRNCRRQRLRPYPHEPDTPARLHRAGNARRRAMDGRVSLMTVKKDPKRQLLGKIAKARGKQFESRIDDSFAYYAQKGFAIIEKTPEPMHPTKNLGNGKFIAYYEKQAQPDYKGTIKGGRTVMFEAKFTAADRMEQSRVLQSQQDYMDRHQALGARCFVIAGFSSGMVYCVPWDIWKTMKDHFGRKYVTEADLEKYQVQTAWNGTLLLLN